VTAVTHTSSLWLALAAFACVQEESAAGAAAQAPAAPVADGRDWALTCADNGTVSVLHKGVPVVKTTFVFWGRDWSWVHVQSEAAVPEDGVVPVRGSGGSLGITWSGTMRAAAANRLAVSLEVAVKERLRAVVGGGLEWRVERGSPSLPHRAPAAVLAPERRGWSWPAAPGQTVKVSFRDPCAETTIEDDGQLIRTFFVSGSADPGTFRVELEVAVPAGGTIAASTMERYGPADTAAWHAGALRHDASPVDLSFLNDKPAGKRGFVQVHGDELRFADGTPARFWGANLAGYGLFVDRAAFGAQARRMARLGYNLIRIHHHDSTGWVDPTVIDKSRRDTRRLDATGLDAVDWWIKCLKDEGIYVWLDLHVGRLFVRGDEIPGIREIERQNGQAFGFCYLNAALQERMREFQAAYLSHVNPYTELAYKDDPAVIGVLVTNENDLTQHFGNLMLRDKDNPHHQDLFERAARAWADGVGADFDAALRTWEPGVSKVFLNELEHRFNQVMLGHLRELSVRVPRATTNFWGGTSLAVLPSLAEGDVIDVHAYGQPEALSVDPRYAANFAHWIACAQVHGKPLTITEWNVEYPAIDRFTAPLYLAALASFQGWDAPMLYNYSQRGYAQPEEPDQWSTYYDPALTGAMPAAALLFRRGDVAPAAKTFCLALGADRLYGSHWTPDTSAALRTLPEQHRLTIGLPDAPQLDWDRASVLPESVTVVGDPTRDFIPAGQSFVRSDTGELWRDWQAGVHTVDTARTQAAAGWLGGRTVRLTDVTIECETRKALIAMTSLDGEPLASSGRILLTALARVAPSPGGRMPFLSEPVRAKVSLRSSRTGLVLHALAGDGTRREGGAIPAADGAYVVNLGPALGTHWFLLEAD
jgi:hypothetical protein